MIQILTLILQSSIIAAYGMYIEVLAALLSLWCVWLAAKNHILNWPISMVASVLYFGIFFQNRFYSESYLQVIFLIFQGYGWWFWSTLNPNKQEKAITKLPQNRILRLAFIFVVLYAVWLYVYTRINPDARFPELDALLTTVSVTALWMQARRYIESWFLWIIADIGYVPMFYFGGNHITALLYTIFIALAIKGYLLWLQEMKKPQEGAF